VGQLLEEAVAVVVVMAMGVIMLRFTVLVAVESTASNVSGGNIASLMGYVLSRHSLLPE
jgi:hypothetical protein